MNLSLPVHYYSNLILKIIQLLKGQCACTCSDPFAGTDCTTLTGAFTVDPQLCNSLPASDCQNDKVIAYCPNKCFSNYSFDFSFTYKEFF